jgi:hypothetical protein
MSVSSIAIIIGLIVGVGGLVACIIVACTHRRSDPMKISLIVMSAGGCLWIIGAVLAAGGPRGDFVYYITRLK